MSFGSLSGPEGGAGARRARPSALHHNRRWRHDGEEREHSSLLVYQVPPSRHGMEPDQLRKADAIEVWSGRALPGGGGTPLGHKIS